MGYTVRELKEKMYDFRNKDQQSDNGCGDGVHQNGGCSQILDLLDAVIAFGAYHIGEVLDGRIEDLTAKYQSDGKCDRHPFQ